MSANDDTTLDPQMLDLLTPEERAAIAGEEVDPADKAALAAIIGESAKPSVTTDDGEDDGEDDGGAGNEPAAAPAAAPAEPAGQDDGAQPAAAAPAPKADPASPTYKAELPADFQEQVAALKEEQDALRQKFKAGEIELDAYEAERDAIAQKQRDLDRAAIKAEISSEMTEQTAAQQWQAAIARQFDAAIKPEAGGIDYRKDAEKQADLDQFVRSLAAKPENADKPMDWFLAEGHKRVLALHDIRPAAPAQKPAAAPAPNRRPPVDAAPASLAHVPGADGPGDVGGEFADLDALEGLELEAAINRMSTAQREKYLAGL